jgi:hypothetical protein
MVGADLLEEVGTMTTGNPEPLPERPGCSTLSLIYRVRGTGGRVAP